MSGVLRRTEELLGSAAGLRWQIAGFALAGGLQGIGLATLIPVFRALAAADTARALVWFAIGLAATLGWGAAFALTTRKGYAVGALQVGNGLLKRLAEHVVRLPLGWFGGARTGQMSSLVGDAQSASLFPALVLQQITVATTTPVAVVVVVAFIDWRLALAFVVLAPVGWLAFRWIRRSQGPARAAESEAFAEVAGRVLEFAQAQPVLRATGRAAEGTPSLNAGLRADRRATVRNLNQGSLPMLGYATVVDLAIGLVSVVGVYLALNGSVDVPTAAAVLVLALRFTGPLWLVGPFGIGLELAATGLNSLRAAVRTPPLPEPEITEHPADSSIAFDDVRFGYTDTPVLDGFTLHCPPRSFTALVGPSGAGKTTVTRLIARFWDVDGGSLRVGGVDVRELDSATLMAQISMVFQHVYLFDTTIDENVRLARPGATDEQVRAAARAARLDEVIARLPMGGATPVGEGGGRLSGGERQRVAIARAFLKDAPIVLLDEVTAALDAENEAAITAAIAQLARDKTVIVIAHRLSTIVAADRIAVLDGGRVAELGTHDELAGSGGLSAAFWADRSAAQRWQLGRDPRGSR